MDDQIQLRLEEVLSLIPCPVGGCWGIHGANTAYYYDECFESHVLEVWPKAFEDPEGHEENGNDQADGHVCFELVEFDFMELINEDPVG